MQVSWFLIALVTPILHALANHVDKHLISRYFQSGGVGALALFSSLFSLGVSIVIFIISPEVIRFESTYAGVLLLNGAFNLLYIVLYLHALELDDASTVVPFFQLVPVFGFILGYFFLKETLLPSQIYGSLVIILGATVLSFDFNKSLKFKRRLVLLLAGSSLLYAVSNVLFKLVAIESGFKISFFWNTLGQVGAGVLLYLLVASYRQQFNLTFKSNSSRVLGLNFANSAIIFLGDTALFYALLMAPVALVLVVSGLQPLFVLLMGIFFTAFFPRLITESLEKKVLIQKIIGVALTVVGSIIVG
jgi:drug/metabolite transporter (DMT)-like permease